MPGGRIANIPDWDDLTTAAKLAIWMAQGVDITAILSKFEFTPADERLARSFIR